MSTTPISPLPQGLADGLKALRAKWGWIVALGVVFLVAGVIAMGSVVAATETAVLVVGIMMLMGGVAEIIAAFSVKTWGKFLLWMLLGVLYVAAGMASLTQPTALERPNISATSWGLGLRLAAAQAASTRGLTVSLEYGLSNRSDLSKTQDRVTVAAMLRF